MDTPPNPIYSKEMVDLLMRIKKHLLTHQELAIRLSDPHLFDKLVELHPHDDPLLQGMLQYLMVLAGPEWSQIYSSGGVQGVSRPHNTSLDSLGKSLLKKSASLYRGLAAGHEHEETPSVTPHEPQADTPQAASDSEDKPRKPVRYYRGQPVPED